MDSTNDAFSFLVFPQGACRSFHGLSMVAGCRRWQYPWTGRRTAKRRKRTTPGGIDHKNTGSVMTRSSTKSAGWLFRRAGIADARPHGSQWQCLGSTNSNGRDKSRPLTTR